MDLGVVVHVADITILRRTSLFHQLLLLSNYAALSARYLDVIIIQKNSRVVGKKTPGKMKRVKRLLATTSVASRARSYFRQQIRMGEKRVRLT